MQKQRNATEQSSNTPAVISFAAWLRQMGRSNTTGWRWVQAGWLNPINISGRPYLTAQDIEQFLTRAAAGEFARKPAGAAARSVEARIAKQARPA